MYRIGTSAQSATVFDAGSGAVVQSLNMGTVGPFAVAVDARARHAFVVEGSLARFGEPGGPNEHNPDGAMAVLDTRDGAGVGSAKVGIDPMAAVDERTGRAFVVAGNKTVFVLDASRL